MENKDKEEQLFLELKEKQNLFLEKIQKYISEGRIIHGKTGHRLSVYVYYDEHGLIRV